METIGAPNGKYSTYMELYSVITIWGRLATDRRILLL